MIQARLCVYVLIGCIISGLAAAATRVEKAPHPIAAEIDPAVKLAVTPFPSDQYITAYDSMTQADWLKTHGMTDAARTLYTEARGLFQMLGADYPLWETNVVAFRIKYCNDELAKLVPAATTTNIQISSQRPPMPPARPSPAVSPSPTPSPADEFQAVEYLRVARQKEKAADIKYALEMYLTVLKNQPRNREAIKGAGRCYLRLGMPANACILLQQGMNLPDPDAELNLLMALGYCHSQKFYKAYQLLLIVLHRQPNNAIAHLAMGVAQAGLNKMEDASRETQTAIQLDSTLGDAYYNLARICLQLTPNSPQTAREYYRNAIRHGAARDPALEKQFP